MSLANSAAWLIFIVFVVGMGTMGRQLHRFRDDQRWIKDQLVSIQEQLSITLKER